MTNKIDISQYLCLPVIKSIDTENIPELSNEQAIFTPMCGRTKGLVCCDHVEFVAQGGPSLINEELRYYSQPVHARLKSGNVGCASCSMPKF